jgi:hypothetical protein
VVVNNFAYLGVTPITVEAIVKADSKLAYKGKKDKARRIQTVIGNVKSAGLSLGSIQSNWSFQLYYTQKRSPRSSSTSTGAGRVLSKARVTTNRWTHLAGVFDGTTLRLYVNGQLQGSKTIKGPYKASLLPFVVGANPRRVTGPNTLVAHELFGGSIKAVRISNMVRYRQNFAPPTKLKEDSSTSLLFDCREGQGPKLRSPVGKEVFGEIKHAQWIELEDNKKAAASSKTGSGGNTAAPHLPLLPKRPPRPATQ